MTNIDLQSLYTYLFFLIQCHFLKMMKISSKKMLSTKADRMMSPLTYAKIPVVSFLPLFMQMYLHYLSFFWCFLLSIMLIETKNIFQVMLSLITLGIETRQNSEAKQKF